MGNLVCLARTVKKSKLVVIFSTGCGENSWSGDEATDKQMASMIKIMSLSSSTPAKLITVLLAIAGPDFLHTYNTYTTPFDVENWLGYDEEGTLTRLSEAGELFKAPPALKAEGEEVGDENENEKEKPRASPKAEEEEVGEENEKPPQRQKV